MTIDDFGLRPHRTHADEDLHDLIAGRQERAAAIVTSNPAFSDWDHGFPANQPTYGLDRLRHSA